MKKIKYVLFLLAIIALLPVTISAKEKVNVYLFKREGCGYCANALTFFTNLSKDEEYQNYFTLVVKDLSNKANASLMEKTAKHFNTEVKGVPFIVIGEQHFEGYANTFDEQLKNAIKNAYENENKDVVVSLTNGNDNHDAAATIVILLAIIAGVAFLIYMARDNKGLEDIKDTKEKEEILPAKKTETKSKTTKKADTKKIAASKQTKKSAPTKSTTTKKTPAKTNTTKKSSNKK